MGVVLATVIRVGGVSDAPDADTVDVDTDPECIASADCGADTAARWPGSNCCWARVTGKPCSNNRTCDRLARVLFLFHCSILIIKLPVCRQMKPYYESKLIIQINNNPGKLTLDTTKIE